MKIGIIINPQAGSANALRLRKLIGEALFRCELEFCIPRNYEELKLFIQSHVVDQKIDNLIICGGDGTVNSCLQHLMQMVKSNFEIPPITIVSSGTANDLASELGLKTKVESVVRRILVDGAVKKIDVIQIESEGETRYMLTNGGIGIAALAAEQANRIKSKIKQLNLCHDFSFIKKVAQISGQSALNLVGKNLYALVFLQALREWSKENWQIEIEAENQKKIITNSAFILISNQAQIGQSFMPAPYTLNNDGQFNVFISEMESSFESIDNILDIRKGLILEKNGLNKSFEVKHCRLKSLNSRRGMNFLGDGEILFRNIFEAHITILKQAMPILVTSPA